MACEWVRGPDGTRAIVCGRGSRRSRAPRCQWCPCPGDYQCDGQGDRPGKTCDVHMCSLHRMPVGPTKDLCPPCSAKRVPKVAAECCGKPVVYAHNWDGDRITVDPTPTVGEGEFLLYAENRPELVRQGIHLKLLRYDAKKHAGVNGWWSHNCWQSVAELL